MRIDLNRQDRHRHRLHLGDRLRHRQRPRTGRGARRGERRAQKRVDEALKKLRAELPKAEVLGAGACGASTRPPCNATRRTNWPGTTLPCCRCCRARMSRPPMRLSPNSTRLNPRVPCSLPAMPFPFICRAKPKTGFEVLRTLKPEELANPAVSVYYGVLLCAAGQGQAAKDYLGRSAKAFLLPNRKLPW